jgi:glycosyltransferase involved in cell wall biosynthesis
MTLLLLMMVRSDKTSEMASAAGAKVIKHDFNQGYGAAIKSCFKAFQNSDADILVTIDGDGQNSPARNTPAGKANF